MSSQNDHRTQTDTIGLIDLMAVVIRYRRMIVIGTVVITGLVAIALVLLPTLGISMLSMQEWQSERKITVHGISETAAPYVSNQPADVMHTILIEIGAEVAKAEDTRFSLQRRTLSESGGSATVQFSLIHIAGNPEQTVTAVEKTESEALERFPSAYEEPLSVAQRALLESVSQAEELIMVVAQSADSNSLPINDVSDVYALGYLQQVAASSVLDVVSKLGAAAQLRELLAKPLVLVQTGSTAGAVLRGSRATAAVGLALALSIVFFVFLAFVLAYLKRARLQPEANQKLRDAWERRP